MLDPIGIDRGREHTIGVAVTATGTANMTQFSILAPPGSNLVGLFYVDSVTTCVVDLEMLPGGSSTWQKVYTGMDLKAAPVSKVLYTGQLYRLNATTLSGGPCTIFVVLT